MQDAFPPVMSYFEPAKRTTAGASFITGQRNRWAALASSASKIVVIGVRVRRHDDHIWGPIASSPAQVVYCGGPSDVTEYRAWAYARQSRTDDAVLSSYFRGDFDRICQEANL